MIIYLYYIFIFFTGLALTYSIPVPSHSHFYRVALALASGIGLPVFSLYGLNLIGIPLTTLNLSIVWSGVGLPLLLWRSKGLYQFIYEVKGQFLKLGRSEKYFVLFLLLGLIGMIARGGLNDIWMGDGMDHWGPKALEWYKHQKFYYPLNREKEFLDWINYPLYHSVGMLVNLLMIPLPPAYSIKLFDCLHILGLYFSVAAFFRWMKFSPIRSLNYALLAVFVQKHLLSYLIPGYADLDIAYYSFLAFLTLLLALFSKKKSFFYLLGFLFGIIWITKDEGKVRVICIVLSSLLCYWQAWKKKSLKDVLAFIIPLGVIVFLDKLSYPASREYTGLYLGRLNLDISWLAERAKIIFHAAIISFLPENAIKSSWLCIWVLAIGVFFTKLKGERRQLVKFLWSLALLGMIFNHIPSWIADVSTSAPTISLQVIQRLHLHVSTFMTTICVITMDSVLPKVRAVFTKSFY